MNVRSLAVLALQAVCEDKRSLSQVLPELSRKHPQLASQSIFRELTSGTLRFYWTLDYLLNHLLEKPLKTKDNDVKLLLLVGLYQLRYLSLPEHVIVNETVNSVTDLKKEWAKNFVNAVLRNFINRREKLEKKITGDPVAVYSHPSWIIDRLRNDWPENYRAILSANNAKAPMYLRVNARRITQDQYLQQLAAADIKAQAIEFLSAGIKLDQPVDVYSLPGFKEGAVSVQDLAAQFAASLIDLQPGQRVLDACSAPGGKTAAMLEIRPDLGEMVALDSDEVRLQRVRETLARIGVQAKTQCADAENVSSWWDGQYFDRILLDAPCSGSGVIRRNPDIKHLRMPTDIETLAAKQRSLLEALWRILKSDGILLYATCSVFKAENELQIESFLRDHDDAICETIELPCGEPRPAGHQIFPKQDDMDGFYYARLRKKP